MSFIPKEVDELLFEVVFKKHEFAKKCHGCENNDEVIILAHPACMFWHFCKKCARRKIIFMVNYYKSDNDEIKYPILKCISYDTIEMTWE